MRNDDARSLLRRLRVAGLEVEADGDALRIRGPREAVRDGEALLEAARDAKPALVAALRDERAATAPLDPAPADVRRGDRRVGIPADKPATARQLERLRELAEHPDIYTQRAREDVGRAVDGGLSQLGAWRLIGDLGRRIASRRGQREEYIRRGMPPPAECPGCGRPVGPTANACGSCKHERRRPEGDQ